MSLAIHGQKIERILVVDDEPAARDSFSYIVEDMGIEPVCQNEPLIDLSSFVVLVRKKADAVLSDYRLTPGNYAGFQGDALVATCYKDGVPAILCSSLSDIDTLVNRRLIRYIPALLRTSNPEPEQLAKALECCISEIDGHLSARRKPRRALIRVVDLDKERGIFYVVLPGWNTRKKICVTFEAVPSEIEGLLEPGRRFHAQVNLGAEHYGELYFDEWEPE